MKGKVELIENVSFRLTSGSGHETRSDGPVEHGGTNAGMRPMELVLLGMGGCTAYDVVEILRKRRRPPDSLEIEIQAQRAEDVPKVFTGIHLKYFVKGDGITAKELERAIKLSLEKYCSATRMLSSTAEITFECQIIASSTD